MPLSGYTKRAITGGVISMFIIAMGTFVLGHLSGYEAKVLIKNSLNGVNTFCNTIILASATILALLLTVLGVSTSSSSNLKTEHYTHILQIAKVDTVVFVASLICFQLLNLPITESDHVSPDWFGVLYYITLSVTSILSAALIVVVLMLYNTVSNIIKIIGLGMTDHPLIAVDEDDEVHIEKSDKKELNEADVVAEEIVD